MNLDGSTQVWRSSRQIGKALLAAGLKKGELKDLSRDIRRRAAREQWEAEKKLGNGGEHLEINIFSSGVPSEWRSAIEQFEALSAAAVNSPCSAAPPAAGQIARDQRASIAAAAGISPIPKPGTPEYEETVRRRLWRDHDAATQDLKDRAVQDTKTARRVKELQDAGCPKGYSGATAAREFGIGKSTTRGWFANELKDVDPKDWAAALLDQRGRRRPSIPSYDQPLYGYYRSDYLRMDRPPRTACYRRAVDAAKTRGIPDDQIAAEITLWRRLTREVTWQAIKFARYGRQAAHRTYPAQTRDRSVLHALECVNGDGYRWNTAVIWPDGELCRPVMFYFQDVFSGMILAWRLGQNRECGPFATDYRRSDLRLRHPRRFRDRQHVGRRQQMDHGAVAQPPSFQGQAE